MIVSSGKYQLALRALRLSEMAGFKPVVQVYADDGESDHVCQIKSRLLQTITSLLNSYD
jgi:hypothetical protein